MKRSYQVILIANALIVAVIIAIASIDTPVNESIEIEAKPTLSVSVINPQSVILPLTLAASGNIRAWQEAIIGNETNGLRLDEVKVNVGDVVKRGQLLAVFSSKTVKAELAKSQAAVTEAKALLDDATYDVNRTFKLKTSGALSEQKIQQYRTAQKTAEARWLSAQANLLAQNLFLEQTMVRAPDDGIISSRTATVGSVLPVGQELFRLIRGSRLEWQAEVSSADLEKLNPGQIVHVTLVSGKTITGTVRTIAPVISTQSRNGLVYVDLPVESNIRAGSFARGQFELGAETAITLPQSAVLLRDGFSYVMRVGSDNRIVQTKVRTGRRADDLVEVVGGIMLTDQVIVTGGAFLGAGDLVRIIPQNNNSQSQSTLTMQIPTSKPINELQIGAYNEF